MATLMANGHINQHHHNLSSKARDQTPTIDMLADIEKRIMQHISDARAREDSMSSTESMRSSYSLPRPKYGASRSRSSSPTVDRTPPMDDIPLDLIFDTPETQVSPSRSPQCELNRRGATFHRIDSATAEADDLRSQQWSRMSNDSSDRIATPTSGQMASSRDHILDGRSKPSPSESAAIRSCQTLDEQFLSRGLSVEMGSKRLPNVPVTEAHHPLAQEDLLNDVAPPPIPCFQQEPTAKIGSVLRLDRRRSRSLSQITAMKAKDLQPLPLHPTTYLWSHSASPRSPDFGLIPSMPSPSYGISSPSKLTLTTSTAPQSRRRSLPISPTLCQMEPSQRSPILLGDGSTALGRTLLAQTTIDFTTKPPTSSRAPRRSGDLSGSGVIRESSVFGSIRTVDSHGKLLGTATTRLDPRRWLPKKSTGATTVVAARKSVVKAVDAKHGKSRPVQNGKQIRMMKKWAVGGSVSDLFDRFKHMEVDEIIDTKTLRQKPIDGRPAFTTKQETAPAVLADVPREADPSDLNRDASIDDLIVVNLVSTQSHTSSAEACLVEESALLVPPPLSDHLAFCRSTDQSNRPDLRVDCIVGPLRSRSQDESAPPNSSSSDSRIPALGPFEEQAPSLFSIINFSRSPSPSPQSSLHSSIHSALQPSFCFTPPQAKSVTDVAASTYTVPTITTTTSPRTVHQINPLNYRHSSSHLPFALRQGPRLAPTTRSRASSLTPPSSRPRTTSFASEPLDWTAFQMAISGPTGDYLMGGGISSSSLVDISYDADDQPSHRGSVSAAGTGTVAEDEELAEWYDSYGFENEGLLVLRDHDKDKDESDYEDGTSSGWGPPIEMPALDSRVTSVSEASVWGVKSCVDLGGRGGGGSGADDSDSDDEDANDKLSQAHQATTLYDDGLEVEEVEEMRAMSCNLNDLGSFLEDETWGLGVGMSMDMGMCDY